MQTAIDAKKGPFMSPKTLPWITIEVNQVDFINKYMLNHRLLVSVTSIFMFANTRLYVISQCHDVTLTLIAIKVGWGGSWSGVDHGRVGWVLEAEASVGVSFSRHAAVWLFHFNVFSHMLFLFSSSFKVVFEIRCYSMDFPWYRQTQHEVALKWNIQPFSLTS